MLEILILVIVSIPLVIIIHELGHAFFIKLFKGNVKGISFGRGKKIFSVGIFSIYKNNPFSGRVHFDMKETSDFQKIIVSSGGILFNILSATLIWILVHFNLIQNYLPIRGFIFYSYLTALFTAIPQVYMDGHWSDGKAILQALKNLKTKSDARF